MTDFYEGVILPSQEADRFVAETGGLPEITRASKDLSTAIDQTREEIATAHFASRFPEIPRDEFQIMLGGRSFSSMTVFAIEDEGEAGLKRAHLMAELSAVEGGLTSLISRLVNLRTDLAVSQKEMSIPGDTV